MGEIIKTPQERKDEQERLRNAMVARLRGGALDSSGRSASPTEYSKDMALLLDRSGSMCAYIDFMGFDGPTRMDRLRELVKDFSGVRQFQYNGEVRELRKGEIVEDANGDNDEVRAFNYLKAAGIKRVVMLTDGGAGEPERALKAAVGLIIDVCYIGPDPQPKFLTDLTKRTGGTYYRGDLKMLKALSAVVKERLQIAAPKGAIQL